MSYSYIVLEQKEHTTHENLTDAIAWAQKKILERGSKHLLVVEVIAEVKQNTEIIRYRNH